MTNAAVDARNVVSLHSGLADQIRRCRSVSVGSKLSITIAPLQASYVFNPSGQVIDAVAGSCVCAIAKDPDGYAG